MKKLLLIPTIAIILLTFLNSCDNDDNKDDIVMETITASDKDALLFMLEEEKLARDTYSYLADLWSINQFANIKKSEQSHMNAVENLLIQYKIAHTILPSGEFANQDLQKFYNQFVIDGAISVANAYQIGATIEDLDIVDLQTNINASSNTCIISVFKSLQCGSRNHLRSFVLGIENIGESYIPQFLAQVDYDAIISGNQEQCN